MKVSQLRDYLEQYEDDAEVMIAHQPSWPLAETLANVTTFEDALDGAVDPDNDSDLLDGVEVVWLVAGGAHYKLSPYAPRDVFSSF
jgi:hypothetical protein